MLPARELGETGVATSAIGFGCAGLFRLPRRRNRMMVLNAAFDTGIRHFDTAPMYGLGLAESELGAFIKSRRAQVTVTTKFGIEPTVLTTGLAPLQAPGRAMLARRPDVNEDLKKRGKTSDSGLVGKLLYRSPRLAVRTAQRSLEASLRALQTDYIDVFLLHDPVYGRLVNPPELVDYLDEQRKAGRIRCWGVTGMPDAVHAVRKCLRWPAVIQHRDDVFESSAVGSTSGARITYGALARALVVFSDYFAQTPGAADIWSERLGFDVIGGAELSQFLFGAALSRNSVGPVLFTTTKPTHVSLAAAATVKASPPVDVSDAFAELTAVVRAAVLIQTREK